MELQYIFVTGEKRSGTTLLSNYLNSQSGVACFSDTFRTLFDNANALGIVDFESALPKHQKNVLISSLIPEGSRIGVDLEFLWESEANSWLEILMLCLETLKSEGGKLIGVKITAVDRFLPTLLKNGFKVVYIQRDPRDVMVSSKNRFGSFFLNSQITNWRKSFWETQKQKGKNNFWFTSYEEIIEQREERLNTLAEFLGVSLNANPQGIEMRKGEKFKANSSFGDVSAPFDKSALYRWKKSKNSFEVRYTNAILKNELKLAGYDSLDESVLSSIKFKFTYGIKFGVRSLASSFENFYKKNFK